MPPGKVLLASFDRVRVRPATVPEDETPAP
jgi:hypothetical protein